MNLRATDPMLGATAGGYRVVSLLSVGGMGSVYRAEHALIGRPAAIKVLLPEMSANHDMVKRFFAEAKTTTSIKHPGIVEVFDFGYLPGGQAFIVMELLDGMTLAQRLHAHGRMHEGEAAMILRSVCGGLSAAHAIGVVHRDLKPDNIFLVPDADAPIGVRCKLLDFGIAKLTAGTTGATTGMTTAGAVMGTPTYMSPEQCKGSGDVDARADLYSLGCIFYELVAGRPPFVPEGTGEMIGSHLFVEPMPPSQVSAGISREAEALIMQLLAKQPGDRVQTARELAARLTALAQAHGWAVSSTDLDARMSMAALPFNGPATSPGGDDSTQVAPPRANPSQQPQLVAKRTPSEHTQPMDVPLPPNDAIVRPTPGYVPRLTKPMPVPTPMQPRSPTPMANGLAASSPTPMPPQVAPYVAPASSAHAAYVPTPTTLSGAAREAQTMAPPAPRRGMRPMRIVLALLVAGAAVGAAVFFATSGGTAATPNDVRPAAGGSAITPVTVVTPPPTPPTPPPVPAVVIDAAVAAPVEIDAAAAPTIVLPTPPTQTPPTTPTPPVHKQPPAHKTPTTPAKPAGSELLEPTI